MPKSNKEFTDHMVDLLADDLDGEVSLSTGPPKDWKPSDDETPRERKFRVKKRGVLGSREDRGQNEALQQAEKDYSKATKTKLGRAPQSLDAPEDYGPAPTPEELSTKTKQALKAVAVDEASGFGAVKRRRAEYKSKLDATLKSGKAWNPPAPPPIQRNLVESRASRSLRAKAGADLLAHNRVQEALRSKMTQHKAEVKLYVPPEIRESGKFNAPKFVIKGLQKEAPVVPEPKFVRPSGPVGEMRPTPTVMKNPKIKPLDAELGNLETETVHGNLPREIQKVFNERPKGDPSKYAGGSKEQQALWQLRMETIGGSVAEDTPSTPRSLTNLIKGVKDSTPAELKDLAKRIDRGGRKGTQISIDDLLRKKVVDPLKDLGEEGVTLSGKIKGAEGVKHYTETVPTPVKPEIHTKDMLSKLSTPKPLESEIKLSGAGKIVKAVEAGEGVALASKSSRLAELLGKGAGKAGIAALLLGGGMAGLRKLGEKLRE